MLCFITSLGRGVKHPAMVVLNSGLSILGRSPGADVPRWGSLEGAGSEGSAFPGSQGASGRFKFAPSRKGASASAGAAGNNAIATTVDNNKVRLNMGYLFL